MMKTIFWNGWNQCSCYFLLSLLYPHKKCRLTQNFDFKFSNAALFRWAVFVFVLLFISALQYRCCEVLLYVSDLPFSFGTACLLLSLSAAGSLLLLHLPLTFPFSFFFYQNKSIDSWVWKLPSIFLFLLFFWFSMSLKVHCMECNNSK